MATAKTIRTLVFLDDGVSRRTVERALNEPDIVSGGYDKLDESWQAPPKPPFDVLVVACSGASQATLGLVESINKQRPHLPIVVFDTGNAHENGFMQRVFEAGADDIVRLPEQPERVIDSLRKAVARRRGAVAAAEPSPLISIVGPKGGTGKTVTALNLTTALAEAGLRPVLVDLDLSFGDVALGLRLTPERTIHDLARVGGSIDAEKLEGYLATHSSGFRVLLAPLRPDHAAKIDPEFLGRVFKTLREAYDIVVVDTPAGFTSEVIAAVDNSSDVCMIGMLDAFSLKDTKLGLETLELMGYSGRIRVLLNRADSHVGITRDDVTQILGRPPDVLVPSEREIARSINEGVPLVLAQKRSAASKAFRELAQLYLSAESANGAGPQTLPQKRIFGRG